MLTVKMLHKLLGQILKEEPKFKDRPVFIVVNDDEGVGFYTFGIQRLETILATSERTFCGLVTGDKSWILRTLNKLPDGSENDN